MPHDQMSGDYEQKKLYEKALQEVQRTLTLQGEPEISAAVGRAYAATGWEGVLRKQIEVYQKRDTNDYDPVAVARSYATLGDRDRAFFWLEKAYYEHARLFL